MGYRITDGEGWMVKKYRKSDGTPCYMWSSNPRDAADIHFYQAAEKLSQGIPFPVRIVWRKDRKPTS
jgi:hypothetical protein